MSFIIAVVSRLNSFHQTIHLFRADSNPNAFNPMTDRKHEH